MSIQLQSLTIRAFRGVRHEITFEFGGRNAVIVGPNGSGKSTVLQAIEFLLTGEVSALRGSGTGGIRVTEHIPNQYANPDDTHVGATFATADGDTLRVERSFTNRSRLRAEDRPPALQNLMETANSGLVYLSRDELLELVLATPGNRQDEIYHLLNTENLDERRRQLKRLARRARDEESTRETRCGEHRDRLVNIVDEPVVTSFDGDRHLQPEVLLEAVNHRRARFDGDPIASLTDVDSFQSGLTSPLDQASHPLQRPEVRRDLSRIKGWTDGDEALAKTVPRLQEELRALRADEDALDTLAQRDLVHQGRTLVDDETGACPLCQTSWEPEELQSHLKRRAERLARIDDRVERIDRLATDLHERLETVHTALDRVVNALDDHEDTDISALMAYYDTVTTAKKSIAGDATDQLEAVDIDALQALGDDTGRVTAAVTRLQRSVANFPDRSTIQTEWDELKSLDETYHALQDAIEERNRYARAAGELETAHETFLAARDDVLAELFDTINNQFADLYEAINPDESAFDPMLQQTNTGVNFAVEFYDTGEHPPNALHSEGHQDLMGVCLFLALAAELGTPEYLPLMLDDVVMSVDEYHRTQFARALENELGDQFQLLITTHDRGWVRQLVESGVVGQSDVVQFSDWTPDGGLRIEHGMF